MENEILSCLQNTLHYDASIRKQAEERLSHGVKQPGFHMSILKIITDESNSIKPSEKVSALIFLKNSINGYWFLPEQVVAEGDKKLVKDTVWQLYINGNNSEVASNILESILEIFINNLPKYGQELLMNIESMWNKDGIENNEAELAGLLSSMKMFMKCYRWFILGFNKSSIKYNKIDFINESLMLFNKFVALCFPKMESLALKIIGNVGSGNLLSADFNNQFKLLYLMMKVFKYSIFNDLPDYLLEGTETRMPRFEQWFDILFKIFRFTYPADYAVSDEKKEFRVKTQKWAAANLLKVYAKYGGGTDVALSKTVTYSINYENHQDNLDKFNSIFQKDILPKYFELFYGQIDQISKNEFKLFDGAKSHVIKFFAHCLNNERIFNAYINENNLKHLIEILLFPSIILSKESVELFYEDEEEFFKRNYDINELYDNNSDIESIKFFYKLSNKYFSNFIAWFFTSINDIFMKRDEMRANSELEFQNVVQTEAGLRLLGILNYQLINDENSPVRAQIDDLIENYIYPEITNTKYLFLTSRALETLALFNYQFKNLDLLSKIFNAIIGLIEKEDNFLVQLECFDALKSLLINKDIVMVLKSNIGSIIDKLLNLINEHEEDFLTVILDDFINIFAQELKPFANDLSIKLSQQFLKCAQELLELSWKNSGSDTATSTLETDKESQCSGIINNISLMVTNMSNNKLLVLSFFVNFNGCIKFTVENCMEYLMDEIMDLSSLFLNTLKFSLVSMDRIFEYIIHNFYVFSFGNFFESFSNFFQSYVVYHYNDLGNIKQLAQENQENPLVSELSMTKDAILSDENVINLVKINLQLMGESLENENLRSINISLEIFQNVLLTNCMDHLKQDFYQFDVANHENAASVMNEILSASVDTFLSLVYTNLEDLILLTEDESDLTYIDYELVFLLNNLLKLVLIAVIYQPRVALQQFDNMSKLNNLISLLVKIDNTNNQNNFSSSVAESDNVGLKLFQLLNKLWLTLNKNNSFTKMLRKDKFFVKLQIMACLKMFQWNAVDNIETMIPNEQDKVWYNEFFLKKLGIKLINLIAIDMPSSLDAASVSALQESAMLNDPYAYGLLGDEQANLDFYVTNEALRLELFNKTGLKISTEFNKFFQGLQGSNSFLYDFLMKFIMDHNIGAKLEHALQLDAQNGIPGFNQVQ